MVGQTSSASLLPDIENFTEDDIGKAYAVGTETPYELYIVTRPFNAGEDLQWFNIGPFPNPGPTGETGEQGIPGVTPNISTTASAITGDPGTNAYATVTKTGSDAAPKFSFTFQIPRGQQRNSR